MAECYLGLGSNWGDRLGYLSEALGRIDARWPVEVVSSVYETDPQIVTDQGAFLNLCCRIDAEAPPALVLRGVNEIEAALGRDRMRERPKGPRMIDIDLLLWGTDTLSEPELTIPHPGLTERQFVLRPLLEIAPGLRDPRDGRSLSAVSAFLPGQGVYCYGKAVVYSA
ncbi:MAG: 2-amino-4-hydroxy-6-hydroxymethyldihydropteridine diphosphokinase [Spirochaetota bacterium]